MEAEVLLLDARVKGGKKGIPRLIRLMDLDEIDIDDEGDVSGLDEEIDRLKADYPELFDSGDEGKKKSGKSRRDDEDDDEDDDDRRRRAKRRSSGSRSVDGSGKAGSKKPKESAEELILRGLRGE
jgi:hypothetical protein